MVCVIKYTSWWMNIASGEVERISNVFLEGKTATGDLIDDLVDHLAAWFVREAFEAAY